ncbi:hypothetical protein O3M35_007116 [Rhynocoris fuscipes]|uniref:DUF229 domain containing protein n=1 Tax=Rhynocoris fuscipes TaxID=488301 RepID=A0AAW1D8B8_9HEMI
MSFYVNKAIMFKFNVRYIMSLLLIISSVSIFWYYRNLPKHHIPYYQIPSSAIYDESAMRYLVDTKGCRIGYMNAYDKSIRDCLYFEEEIDCDKDGRGMLVNYNGNTLYVNMTLLPKYRLTEEILHCCYQPFRMINSTYEQVKQSWLPEIRYDNCTRFTRVIIKDEFIKVKCSLPNNETYEDVFVFVQERDANLQREDDKLSVLVIGFDAVSRLNFHRQMQKTVQFLKEQNAVEMFGYNKVGENTYPNLVAMLSGLSEQEIEKVCLHEEYKTFDNCPLIWKNYKSNGFMTGYGEDLGWYGLLSTTDKFRRREYQNAATDFFLNQLTISAFHLRNDLRFNYNICIGKRLAYEILIDAVKQFAINLKNLPTFGFFFTFSLSHDTLNRLIYGDDFFYKFLQTLSAHGVFNRTILIILSDHGMRFGKIRETYQGFLEEKLPLLFFKFPPWFSNKYPKALENLKANAHRLVSAYDIYKTFIDLIDLKSISNSELDNRTHSKKDLTLGTSLFLPIDEKRSCNDAGIPKYYCTCDLTGSVPISINDRNVKLSSIYIIDYVNELLKDHQQCTKLYFNRIIDARFVRKPSFRNKKLSIVEYKVIVETKPSLAIFEGFVRHNEVMNSFDVLPPISRVNAYGNQSYCVESSFLKLYCYCDLENVI